MKKEFEKGMEYEVKRKNISFHLFMGWSCLVLSPIWFFFSFWDFRTRFLGGIVLLIFGLLSLWLGYSEIKEIKKIEREW